MVALRFILMLPKRKTQPRQICAEVAQSVEQGTENPRVGGSNPSLGTTDIKGLVDYDQALKFLLYVAVPILSPYFKICSIRPV